MIAEKKKGAQLEKQYFFLLLIFIWNVTFSSVVSGAQKTSKCYYINILKDIKHTAGAIPPIIHP